MKLTYLLEKANILKPPHCEDELLYLIMPCLVILCENLKLLYDLIFLVHVLELLYNLMQGKIPID